MANNPPKHLCYYLLILRQKLSIPSTLLGMVRGMVSSSNHNPEPVEGLNAKADIQRFEGIT